MQTVIQYLMMILSGSLLQGQTISDNHLYSKNQRFDISSENYEIFKRPSDGRDNVITPVESEYLEKASSQDAFLIFIGYK